MRDRIISGEFENKLPYNLDPAIRTAYRSESKRLEDLFREESLKAVGLADYKLKDRVMDLAWENGHANGLYEVFQDLEDLATLIIE